MARTQAEKPTQSAIRAKAKQIAADEHREQIQNRKKKAAAPRKRNADAQARARADHDPKKKSAKYKVPEVRASPETTKTKGPLCGAKRSKNYATNPDDPGTCTQPAGWGTDHVGYGHCRFHGGTSRQNKVAADREMAAELILKREMTYGAPKVIGPHEALLEEIHRTAGHVAWLQWVVSELDPTDLTILSPQGITPTVWLEMYGKERDRLVNVCRAAISAGCQERTVQLEEDKGRLLAMVIRDILWDKALLLSPEQKHLAGEVVRKHLMILDANQREQDDAATARLRPAIPAASKEA